MSEPTWRDLEARNAAAAKLNVSGALRVLGEADTGPVDDRYLFWYGTGDRWWVERNGSVAYASSSSTDTVPVARQGGQMVHQRRSGLIRVGRLFVPRDLFGPHSLLIRRTKVQHVPHRPKPVDFKGRPGWSVDLLSSDGIATEMVFDDRTGVLVGLSSLHHGQWLQLDNLVEHTELPAADSYGTEQLSKRTIRGALGCRGDRRSITLGPSNSEA